MNSNQMKNIIVLKNLPSNLIDEAFIILKNNKKIKALERIDKNNSQTIEREKTENYIIKEAEMIISDYLSKVEKEKQMKSYAMRRVEEKYKRLKIVSIVLCIVVFLNVILAL